MIKTPSSHTKIIVASSCFALILLALGVFCCHYRYYSPTAVSAYYEEFSLYKPIHIPNDDPIPAVTAHYPSWAFRKLEGMTYEEIHDRFGEPHALAGSGVIRDIFFTTDGYLISIRYDQDIVCLVKKIILPRV